MNVLVDTSVWSVALRRARPAKEGAAAELAELVREGRVAIMGPIRQELLSGIKSSSQYDALRERLRAFPDLGLDTGDFESAADAHNKCRAKGVQGSHTDFLICAVALRRRLSIYTTDDDFTHYARVLKVTLHQARG